MYTTNIIILFFLILFFNLTYEQGSNSHEIRDLSLSRPYSSVFSTYNAHWDLTGNTLVTDKFIRLTSDSQSKAGGLWNSIPIPYPDWEIHVQYKVHGNNKNFYGDGFVIWYVKEPKQSGPVFGYKDYFTGLAIVMDTYANQIGFHPHTYPYISAIVNNGSLHYDHDRDGAEINLAGCESSFRGRDTDTYVAVRYENDRLIVSTDIDGKGAWIECFSVDNIKLPTHYYFGLSAATGELSDNHDIISVHTYQLESSDQRRNEDRKEIIPSGPPLNATETVTAKGETANKSSAFKIFLVVAGVIIVIVVGIGFYFYSKNRRRGPRFY